MRKKKPGPKKKKRCSKGHLLTTENTTTNSKGQRRCKICNNANTTKWNRIRRGKAIKEKKLEKLCIRIEKLTRTNSIIRQSWWNLDLKFYRASYLKEIDIGSCYLAEIRAAQTGTFREGTHINQADVRRMSA